VQGGSYHVHAPPNWDHKTPLPTLVFLHGWLGSGDEVIGNEEYLKFADESGLLLVAPTGEGKTWSFPGSPGHYRDEVAFMKAVLADVETRYPVDRSKLWASGFSQGGSMVWYIACAMGSSFRAYAPVAGAFWKPMPEECASGPIDMRHVHGLSDQTVPMQGRQLRGGAFAQGDVRKSIDVIRQADACTEETVTEQGEDGTTCERFKVCGSGRSLQLCLHNGGHFVNVPFLRAGWNWVKSLPPRP